MWRPSPYIVATYWERELSELTVGRLMAWRVGREVWCGLRQAVRPPQRRWHPLTFRLSSR